MRDAAEIAKHLGRRIEPLARELLPAGQREGHEWRVGSVAGEKGRSLSVHLSGARAGVWADFAGEESGDALDLVAAVLYRGELTPAIGWARKWLGFDAAAAPDIQRRAPSLSVADAAPDVEEADRIRAALRIFLAGAPSLKNTAAAAYLMARGIDLAELGRQPRSLRFHPALHNRESGSPWPALVAAVTDDAGKHVATHRTWLALRDDRWGKAPLRDPKMSLGRVAGGSIRLWRGASGKPLAQAPQGETVVIAEGIETALSIVVSCPEYRVLSAVSLSNMARLALPPAVTGVILAADNDGDNRAAARALQQAVDRFAGEGRAVRIARSPIGSDFNDLLTSECSL